MCWYVNSLIVMVCCSMLGSWDGVLLMMGYRVLLWCYCDTVLVMKSWWCCVWLHIDDDGDVVMVMVMLWWWYGDGDILMVILWWWCWDGDMVMVIWWWWYSGGDIVMVIWGCCDVQMESYISNTEKLVLHHSPQYMTLRVLSKHTYNNQEQTNKKNIHNKE